MGAKKNPRASRHINALMEAMEWVVSICVVRWDIIDSVVLGQRKMGKMSAKSWS
jgi:hypothetical protein